MGRMIEDMERRKWKRKNDGLKTEEEEKEGEVE